MPPLPPSPDIAQLRRQAKDRLQAARRGDPAATEWINQVGGGITLGAAQLRLAREHGFDSWPAMHLEIARRLVLDLHNAGELAALLTRYPDLATSPMRQWCDHPRGAYPLGYVAMARYDTAGGRWRDVPGAADVALALLSAGAPVDGDPGEPETPLITAASYGDADVAAVLIAAGADVDARAADDAGGVPGGTTLLHAAVFGMTSVVDVLAVAGATVHSIEEAAAVGDVSAWLTSATPEQDRLRALIMAADHERLAVMAALIGAGTPVDAEDRLFGRHPLRLAAANGRPASVRALLAAGADPARRDRHGRSPSELCRAGRVHAADPAGHDEAERILRAAAEPPDPRR
ncbi:MAG: ankyrin repeat domain-containing protein [Ilumatobacteraceae bacterium]